MIIKPTSHTKKFQGFIEKLVHEFLQNIDLRDKFMGDRIKVWNYGSLTTYEQDFAHPINPPEYYIVVATDQDVLFNAKGMIPVDIRQDLIIVDLTTKEKYRVCALDVCLIDDNK